MQDLGVNSARYPKGLKARETLNVVNKNMIDFILIHLYVITIFALFYLFYNGIFYMNACSYICGLGTLSHHNNEICSWPFYPLGGYFCANQYKYLYLKNSKPPIY